MTAEALRVLATRAAGRGEWIKAADLHSQASDMETLTTMGRNPYDQPARAASVRPMRDPPPAFTTDQLNEAERLLAGSRLTLQGE